MDIFVPVWVLWALGVALYCFMSYVTVNIAGVILMDVVGWWALPCRAVALFLWPVWWVGFFLTALVAWSLFWLLKVLSE